MWLTFRYAYLTVHCLSVLMFITFFVKVNSRYNGYKNSRAKSCVTGDIVGESKFGKSFSALSRTYVMINVVEKFQTTDSALTQCKSVQLQSDCRLHFGNFQTSYYNLPWSYGLSEIEKFRLYLIQRILLVNKLRTYIVLCLILS